MWILLKCLIALVAGLAVFMAVLHYLPDGKASSAIKAIKASSRQTMPQPADQEAYANLPQPVKAWLDQAAPAGSADIIIARVHQSGSFRPEGNRWLPLEADQYFLAHPPAFVWQARIWLMPLVWLHGRDIYRDGAGSFNGSLLSLIPLVSGVGPQTDIASLQRWISEAVWLPTALRPGPQIEWTGLGHKRAKVKVTDGELSAEGEFIFGEDNLPHRFTCQRYRDLPGGMQNQPWGVSYSNYQRLKGYLVPTQAEVAWLPQGREFRYGRIKLDGVWYNAEAMAD